MLNVCQSDFEQIENLFNFIYLWLSMPYKLKEIMLCYYSQYWIKHSFKTKISNLLYNSLLTVLSKKSALKKEPY